MASVVMHMADMTVVRLLVRALDGRGWRMLGPTAEDRLD